MTDRLIPWVTAVGFLAAGLSIGATARPVQVSPFVVLLDGVQWVELAFWAIGRGFLTLAGVA